MFTQKLSRSLGQLKKGFAYDSPFGKTPVAQAIIAPDAADTAGILASIDLTAVARDIPLGIPEVDTITITGTWAAADYIDVTINGIVVRHTAVTGSVAVGDIATGVKAAIEADSALNDLVSVEVAAGVATVTKRAYTNISGTFVCTEEVSTAGNGDAAVAVTSPVLAGQPDVPRNLQLTWATLFALGADVVVRGVDAFGNNVSETLTPNIATITVAGTWAADDTCDVTIAGVTVQHVAVGGSVAVGDIATGIVDAIEADETLAALVSVESTAGVVTITDAGTATAPYAISTEDTTAGDGTSTAAVTVKIGNVAFDSVLSILVPALTGHSISIGIGTKLGLARPINASADIDLLEADGTPGTTSSIAEAASAVDSSYSTVITTTAPDGTANFKVFYKAVVI